MSAHTYDRNISKKYRSTATDKYPHYNPIIVEYYDSGNHLVRIEHKVQKELYPTGSEEITVWYQTISGSNFAQNWPSYTYTIVYGPWGTTTESGILNDNYPDVV